jgi:hypothetical protein
VSARPGRAGALALGVACSVAAIFAVRSCDGVLAAPPKPLVPAGPDAAGPPTQLKSTPTLKRVRFEVSPGGAEIGRAHV